MMKTKVLIGLFACGLLWSCRKTEVPLTPRAEDWTFPNRPDTVVTLYSDRRSVAVNEPFDVKLVFYNFADTVFGAAVEMSYTSDTLQVEDIVTGPYLAPESNILVVKRTEPDSNRVSYGVTLRGNTSNRGINGSGVVMKLKCRGSRPGRASISFNTSKLEIWKPNGMPVDSLGSLRNNVENFTIVVQ